MYFLICGYGYGTTAVVKDALLNSYQVFVKKSISAYQMKYFTEWSDIDVVISTVDVEFPVEKPFAKLQQMAWQLLGSLILVLLFGILSYLPDQDHSETTENRRNEKKLCKYHDT